MKSKRDGGSSDLVDRIREEFLLELAPDSSSIGTARAFAASLARHFECSDELIEDVKIAISETVTNAVKAHHSIDSAEQVVVRAYLDGSHLVFEVVDRGPGFDFTPSPPTTQPTVLRMGSLGLALVRSLFPVTDVRRNEDRGMTVAFSVDVDQLAADQRSISADQG